MSKVLNITNGDCAVDIMKTAGIVGDMLPWRDVLHDGPVPAGLTLEELSNVRAEFITGRGWGDFEVIKQDFIDRDNLLKSYDSYDKVVLWFEHDLYDQLQIIQILDWFSKNRVADFNLTMICTENYLGLLSPDEMKDIMQYELPITKEQLELANYAWSAFCSDTPSKWAGLLNQDTKALPFLAGAILRQLEEYPDCKTGLSRTAYQALKIFSQGETRCGKVFGVYYETEERKFLGDSSFWVILDEMVRANPPLLVPKEGNLLHASIKKTDNLSITAAGEDVLKGKANFVDYFDIDRWIGGTHLTKDNLWCWDAVDTILVNGRLLVKKS
jgi:hypothetical protein